MSDEKPTFLERLDRKLEKLETKIVKKFYGDRTKITRVGHCAFCGVWCKGSMAEGFVHEDGEVVCHNIDEKAIPRQVWLENKQLQSRDILRRLNNDGS